MDLADSKHSLTVTRSDGARACSNIGNIINGLLPDKMVDPDWLQPYGVSVREADDQGALLAYIPLNVQPDQTGGGKAAFRARMIYELAAAGDWQQAQKGRIVWMVQTLTDSCDETDFVPSEEAEEDAELETEERAAWCANPAHRTQDAASRGAGLL